MGLVLNVSFCYSLMSGICHCTCINQFYTTLIFISGRGSAISSTKQVKSGSYYNLAKNK